MELETAARRHLLAESTINGYVAGKVFKFSLLERVDGTAGVAIVVRRSSGWGNPDPINTSEYPILALDVWADPSRDKLGAQVADDAPDKALAVYRALDRLLHGKRDQWWGNGGGRQGLRIVSSARWADPFMRTRDEVAAAGQGDGGLGDQPLAEEAVLTAQYALHVAY